MLYYFLTAIVRLDKSILRCNNRQILSQIYSSHAEVYKERIKPCLIVIKIVYNSYLVILYFNIYSY